MPAWKRWRHFCPISITGRCAIAFSPEVFGKHKTELAKDQTSGFCLGMRHTRRLAAGMLMRWFLDEDFRPEYLEMPAAVRSEKYYVNMMTAWFFATALAKQWDARHLPYREQNQPRMCGRTTRQSRKQGKATGSHRSRRNI